MEIIIQTKNKNMQTGREDYGAGILNNQAELNKLVAASVAAMKKDYDLQITICIMAVRS